MFTSAGVHTWIKGVAVCCSVLQCVAVCYSVLQCVAVRSYLLVYTHKIYNNLNISLHHYTYVTVDVCTFIGMRQSMCNMSLLKRKMCIVTCAKAHGCVISACAHILEISPDLMHGNT